MSAGTPTLRTDLVVLACVLGIGLAVHALPSLYPPGLPAGGPEKVDGIITVPEAGWSQALFEPLSLIVRNQNRRPGEGQRVNTICLLPGPRPASLDAALAQATSPAGRIIRVHMQVEPRYSSGPCMDRHHIGRPAARHWGRHLRILRVESAQPVLCERGSYLRRPVTCITGAATPVR